MMLTRHSGWKGLSLIGRAFSFCFLFSRFIYCFYIFYMAKQEEGKDTKAKMPARSHVLNKKTWNRRDIRLFIRRKLSSDKVVYKP